LVAVAGSAPRVRAVRAWSESLGDEAVELAASAGLILDDWQADALRAMLAVGADGRWLHFEFGLNVARQNGKGGILEARELAALFLTGEKLAVHSAHEFATSQEHFRRVEDLIQNTPELHAKVKGRSGYRHSHGDESINLASGQRLVFKTRTKSGLRGFASWRMRGRRWIRRSMSTGLCGRGSVSGACAATTRRWGTWSGRLMRSTRTMCRTR
jgi:hypothetical protein